MAFDLLVGGRVQKIPDFVLVICGIPFVCCEDGDHRALVRLRMVSLSAVVLLSFGMGNVLAFDSILEISSLYSLSFVLKSINPISSIVTMRYKKLGNLQSDGRFLSTYHG